MTWLVLALLGAKEVHGVDIHAPWLHTFEVYLAELNLDLPVYPAFGDVARLNYPSGYSDIALSIEAVSHYRCVLGFIREAHRVLKKGGILLVADGNNKLNPLRAVKVRRIWRRFEEGPPGEVNGHKVKTPYVVMRREIIQQEFPQLNELEHPLAC